MHSQCGSRKGDVNNCVCTFDVTESFLDYVASAQFIEARLQGYRSYFSVMADDKPQIGGKRRGSPSPAPAVKRLAIDADINVAKATVSKAPAMAAARKRSIPPAVSPSTEVYMQEGSVSTLPPPPPRMSEQSSTMSLASSSNALASASAGDPPKMSPPKTAPPTNLISTETKHDPRWDLLTESPSTIQSSDATASADAWVSAGLTVEPTPAMTPSNWSVDHATGTYQPSSLTKFQNSPHVDPVTGEGQPWGNRPNRPWGSTADRIAPSSMLGADPPQPPPAKFRRPTPPPPSSQDNATASADAIPKTTAGMRWLQPSREQSSSSSTARPTGVNDVPLPKTSEVLDSQLLRSANNTKTRRTGNLHWHGTPKDSTHELIYGVNTQDIGAIRLLEFHHRRHGVLKTNQALPRLSPEAVVHIRKLDCFKPGSLLQPAAVVDQDIRKAMEGIPSLRQNLLMFDDTDINAISKTNSANWANNVNFSLNDAVYNAIWAKYGGNIKNSYFVRDVQQAKDRQATSQSRASPNLVVFVRLSPKDANRTMPLAVMDPRICVVASRLFT